MPPYTPSANNSTVAASASSSNSAMTCGSRSAGTIRRSSRTAACKHAAISSETASEAPGCRVT